jgi:hypothetical protein
MSMHVNSVPEFKSSDQVAALLRDVVLKCMQKDPAMRYQDAAEILPILLQRENDVQTKNSLLLPLAIVCSILLCVIGGFLILKQTRGKSAALVVDVTKPKNSNSPIFFRQGKGKIDDRDSIHKDDDADQLRHWADEIEMGSVAAPPDFEKAGWVYAKARKMALRDKQFTLAARCMLGLAVTKLKQNNTVDAEACLMRCYKESSKLGYEKGIYDSCNNLADLASGRHDLTAAANYMKIAVANFPREEMGYFGAVRKYVSILLRQRDYLLADKLLKDCVRELHQMDQSDVRNESAWTQVALLELAVKTNNLKDIERLAADIKARSKDLPKDFARSFVSVSVDLYELKQFALSRQLAECVLAAPNMSRDISSRTKAEALIEKCSRLPQNASL